MNSKEIEEQSGMSRANIRYYEKEGLLRPSRLENGYRDYSQEDLAILQRIALLRRLGMPIEQIRRIQAEEVMLGEALSQRLSQLGGDLSELESARALCQRLLEDRVEYRCFDARRYFNEAAAPAEKRVLQEDVIPRMRHPWRRFFARSLDLQLDLLLWACLLYFVFGLHPLQSNFLKIVNGFMGFAVMLFLEPLLLSWFGTTPGKWIFGLVLTDSEGRNPGYQAALVRCWKLFRWGEGFNIPFYAYYRNYQSYLSCDRGEELPWDEGFIYTIRDTHPARAFGFAAAYSLVIALSVLADLEAQMPKHRGEISAAQFADNYNDYQRYLRVGTGYTLNPDGSWNEPESNDGYLVVIGPNRRPAFTIVETDGVVTQVGFTVELQDNDWVVGYQPEMELAALSYLAAQPGMNWFRTNELMKRLEHGSLQEFSFPCHGIDVNCEVEYRGFESFGDDLLFPLEGADHFYSLRFWMEKTSTYP